MTWTAFHLEQSPAPPRGRRALAEATGIAPDRIEFVHDICASGQLDARLVVETIDRGGEFPVEWSLHSAGPRLPDALDVACTLARLIETRMLVSDDDPNPYRWLLISPSNPPQQVSVDMKRLDEADQLWLAPV